MAEHYFPRAIYALVGLVGGICIVLIPLLALGHGEPHSSFVGERFVGGTAASLVAIAWAVFFAAKYYRAGDEFQREREKSAWYWGGTVGLAASVPPLFFIGVGGLHWVDSNVPAGLDLMRAFLLGYFLPTILMTLGYVVSRFWPQTFRR
jgi:hypothetical protein